VSQQAFIRLADQRCYAIEINAGNGEVWLVASISEDKARYVVDFTAPFLAIPRPLSSPEVWQRYWLITYGFSPHQLALYSDFLVDIDFVIEMKKQLRKPRSAEPIPPAGVLLRMLHWLVRREESNGVGVLYHAPWAIVGAMNDQGALAGIQRYRIEDAEDLPYYLLIGRKLLGDQKSVLYVGGDEAIHEASTVEPVTAHYEGIYPLAMDHLWRKGTSSIPIALRPYAGIILCVS